MKSKNIILLMLCLLLLASSCSEDLSDVNDVILENREDDYQESVREDGLENTRNSYEDAPREMSDLEEFAGGLDIGDFSVIGEGTRSDREVSRETIRAIANFYELNMLLNPSGTEEYGERFKELVSNELIAIAEQILQENTCDASLADMFFSFELAANLQILGEKVFSEKLIQWSFEVYRGYVVDAVMAIGDPRNIYDVLDEGRSLEFVSDSDNLRKRLILVQYVQFFGFDDIDQKLLRGEYIKPVCIQLWDLSLTIDYYNGDGISFERAWTTGINLDEIPLYKAHPDMDLEVINYRKREKGFFNQRKMWWDDGADRYTGTVEGDIHWYVHISYRTESDFSGDYLLFSAGIDIGSDKLEVSWSDGMKYDYDEIKDVPRQIMEIPFVRFWQRERIYEKIYVIDDDEYVEAAFTYTFTPTRRVRLDDFLAQAG